MPGQLEGKTALITGAARGQGRSHAVRLAQEGANIIALDICRQIESVAYPMGTDDDLRQTTAMVEALGRHVVARGVDVRAIVLTGSTLGLVGRGGDGTGGSDGYCASKHAIVGLARTWSHWLAPHNIRVTSVHPTGANTPMVVNDAVAKRFADSPTSSGADVGNLLNVGLIEAADVSNAIAWLVSDQARYVTGIALPVDAGFTAR